MEEELSNIIQTTLHSFDFTFCAIVNIATYLFIKSINDFYPNKCMNVWHKRIAFIIIALILGFIYIKLDSDVKIILNSIIIAPVSWSWIFKPICVKLNIDYSKNCNIKEN